MEKTNFDQLLERYLTGEVSEQEKRKLEAWLEVRKTNDSAHLDLSKDEEEKLFQKIMSSKDNVREIRAFKTKKKNNGVWLLRIAASLIFLLGVAYLGTSLLNKTDFSAERYTEEQTQKLILNDGSIVWLRGESSLEYYEKPGGVRYAELQGEGLFEVAKDPEHPFIIQCGTATLKVLGTSFNVKVDQKILELEVLTGTVNLSLESDEEGVDVMSNEKVLYNGSGPLVKEHLNPVEKQSLMAHTEYNMQFNNETLTAVIKRLEHKFDVTINLNSPIGDCRITADLTDNGLDRSLQLMTEVLTIEFTRHEYTFSITGPGCH